MKRGADIARSLYLELRALRLDVRVEADTGVLAVDADDALVAVMRERDVVRTVADEHDPRGASVLA